MATQPTRDDVLQAIRAIDQRFLINAAAGNVEKLVDEFYAPDAKLVPPNRPAVQGRASIIEFWRQLVAIAKRVTLDTTHVEAAGDLACGIGQYSIALEVGPGQVVNDAGKYIVVYRKHGGEWRAIADIWNSNAAAG
jgi:ketosteroid isomerase-like protein